MEPAMILRKSPGPAGLSSPISLLLAYFNSISATEVSKRSTNGTPALDKALIAIKAAP